jgi:hypothetical protein
MASFTSWSRTRGAREPIQWTARAPPPTNRQKDEHAPRFNMAPLAARVVQRTSESSNEVEGSVLRADEVGLSADPPAAAAVVDEWVAGLAALELVVPSSVDDELAARWAARSPLVALLLEGNSAQGVEAVPAAAVLAPLWQHDYCRPWGALVRAWLSGAPPEEPAAVLPWTDDGGVPKDWQDPTLDPAWVLALAATTAAEDADQSTVVTTDGVADEGGVDPWSAAAVAAAERRLTDADRVRLQQFWNYLLLPDPLPAALTIRRRYSQRRWVGGVPEPWPDGLTHVWLDTATAWVSVADPLPATVSTIHVSRVWPWVDHLQWRRPRPVSDSLLALRALSLGCDFTDGWPLEVPLPDRLQVLHVGDGCDGPLPQGRWPRSLRVLVLGLRWRAKWLPAVLPPQLVELQLCGARDRTAPLTLPVTLQRLCLAKTVAADALQPGWPPPSLRALALDTSNRQATAGEPLFSARSFQSLAGSLEYLRLDVSEHGWENVPPQWGSLPRLRTLHFRVCSRVTLTLPGEWLAAVQTLSVTGPCRVQWPAELPALRVLRVGGDYNQPLPADLPRLEQLYLGAQFHYALPQSCPRLHTLMLGRKFAHRWPSGLLAGGVLHTLGLGVNSPPLPADLGTVRRLKLSNGSRQLLTPVQLARLTHLQLHTPTHSRRLLPSILPEQLPVGLEVRWLDGRNVPYKSGGGWRRQQS